MSQGSTKEDFSQSGWSCLHQDKNTKIKQKRSIAVTGRMFIIPANHLQCYVVPAASRKVLICCCNKGQCLKTFRDSYSIYIFYAPFCESFWVPTWPIWGIAHLHSRQLVVWTGRKYPDSRIIHSNQVFSWILLWRINTFRSQKKTKFPSKGLIVNICWYT